jgi:acyl-CoA synthetase (NDP forming)
MYLEGVARLRDLADVGELAAHLGKIVVLAVGGQSADGSVLATSHTGALATEHRVVSGVARQFGIIPAVDVEELVWAAEAICRAGARLCVPHHRSDVALIGLTGGGVILAADALARSGIPLEQPTARGAARIRRVVGQKEILNPVDGGALALTLADSHGALVDAYVDDPRYQIVACVAGMGLPPPTPSHIHLYDALAAGTARTGKIGVLVSPLPDAANGLWDMPSLVTARSMHEGAVKIRVLRDVLRTDAGSRGRAELPATADELAGAQS